MKELKISPEMFTQEQLDEIIDWSFTNWVDSLHGLGNKFFEKDLGREVTDEEEQEIFLALFKRMIDEGLILAHAPINGEPEKEIQGDKFWDVSSDKMIEYIRSVLPSDPKYLWSNFGNKDDEWGKFWYYDCPQIRWVDKETGQIY